MKILHCLLFICVISCSAPPTTSLQVTEVEQSSIKDQSIANCWVYALTGWMESLHLQQTGQELDISESYWTYWHFYERLRRGPARFGPEGSYSEWVNLAKKYGYLLEGEFIPEEEGIPESTRQEQALAVVKEAIADGALTSASTDEEIFSLLDRAFRVNMADFTGARRDALSLEVLSPDGSPTSLGHLLDTSNEQAWTEIPFNMPYRPRDADDQDPWLAWSHDKYQANLRSILRTLNAGLPVVLAFNINYDAYEGDFFRGADLPQDAEWTASHLVLLEDYTVTDVPGIGELPEGNLSDEMKEAALEGRINYLRAKNSWGTTPERDGTLRIELSYLESRRADGFRQSAAGGKYFVVPKRFLEVIPEPPGGGPPP